MQIFGPLLLSNTVMKMTINDEVRSMSTQQWTTVMESSDDHPNIEVIVTDQGESPHHLRHILSTMRKFVRAVCGPDSSILTASKERHDLLRNMIECYFADRHFHPQEELGPTPFPVTFNSSNKFEKVCKNLKKRDDFLGTQNFSIYLYKNSHIVPGMGPKGRLTPYVYQKGDPFETDPRLFSFFVNSLTRSKDQLSVSQVMLLPTARGEMDPTVVHAFKIREDLVLIVTLRIDAFDWIGLVLCAEIRFLDNIKALISHRPKEGIESDEINDKLWYIRHCSSEMIASGLLTENRSEMLRRNTLDLMDGLSDIANSFSFGKTVESLENLRRILSSTLLHVILDGTWIFRDLKQVKDNVRLIGEELRSNLPLLTRVTCRSTWGSGPSYAETLEKKHRKILASVLIDCSDDIRLVLYCRLSNNLTFKTLRGALDLLNLISTSTDNPKIWNHENYEVYNYGWFDYGGQILEGFKGPVVNEQKQSALETTMKRLLRTDVNRHYQLVLVCPN